MRRTRFGSSRGKALMLASSGLAAERNFSSFPSVPVSTISRIALAMASPMPA